MKLNHIPKIEEVVNVLQPIQIRWYEIFLFLGVQRDILDQCYVNHPCDDHSSLMELIIHWLKRREPLPSWRELVGVIQNILMEGDVAIEIQGKYCPEWTCDNEGMYICE